VRLLFGTWDCSFVLCRFLLNHLMGPSFLFMHCSLCWSGFVVLCLMRDSARARFLALDSSYVRFVLVYFCWDLSFLAREKEVSEKVVRMEEEESHDTELKDYGKSSL
jgi:hypothetical protein